MNSATGLREPALAVKPLNDSKGVAVAGVANRRKILFVLRTEAFGGIEIVLLDWLAAVDFSLSQVVIATSNEVFAKRLAETQCPARRIPFHHRGARTFWARFREWRSFLSAESPDVVVFLEGSPPPDYDLAAAVAGYVCTRGNCFFFQGLAPVDTRPASKRHFGFLPGLGLYWRIAQLSLILRSLFCSKTLVASRSVARRMMEYQHYPEGNLEVVYHGADCERFRPSQARRIEFRVKHEIPADAVVIVSHGRLTPQKRVDRILRAFDVLSAENENLWLVLTAFDSLAEDVAKSVAAMKNRDRVKLVDFLPDPSAMVQAGDVFVMASDNEGFGIALVEAMAAELLCVATQVPGPTEIIESGRNGLLVPATDDGVLNGLRSILALDGESKVRMRKQAGKTVLEKFEVRRNARCALAAMRIPNLPMTPGTL